MGDTKGKSEKKGRKVLGGGWGGLKAGAPGLLAQSLQGAHPVPGGETKNNKGHSTGQSREGGAA